MTRTLLAAALALLSLTACNTGNARLDLIGKPAPALNLPDHPLRALRGHVVVLNFWASWCPPCLEEFPSLIALQQQVPEVTVLAVSYDRDPDAYAKFVRLHAITLRTALDSSGLSSDAYKVSGPPETFIIDGGGIIRRRFIGAQDWTSPEIEGYLRALR